MLPSIEQLAAVDVFFLEYVILSLMHAYDKKLVQGDSFASHTGSVLSEAMLSIFQQQSNVCSCGDLFPVVHHA